jgi:hypothetical protein
LHTRALAALERVGLKSGPLSSISDWLVLRRS